LAQQRVTLSDHGWPFHSSRAISALAELLVNNQPISIRLVELLTESNYKQYT